MSDERSLTGQLRPTTAVLFGSYDEFRHPRVTVLREGLRDAGWEVTVVNEPLGASTADKVAAARSPLAAARFAARVVRSWARLLVRGRRVPAPDVVVVGYLGHLDVHLARLLWRRSVVVLDHLVGLADTVRDRGLDTGVTHRLLDAVDRAALARADVVVVDTDEQLAQLPASARGRAVVVPVGAATTWFEQTPPPPPPPLRVCFVGLFTPLHGAPVIGHALAILHERGVRLEVSMVGTGQDLAATREAAGPAAADVQWIDWVDAPDLPGFVASHHVSLGIFGTTPKALRVVPTKVYQGVAAGTTVVTSDTAPQRRALGDAAVFVPPGDAEALATALASLADDCLPMAPGSSLEREQLRPLKVTRPLLRRLVESGHGRRDLSRGPALSPAAWLRFDLVRRYLEQSGPRRVLEIGPGRGAIAARLVAAGDDYTGVELSRASRDATRALLDGLERKGRVVGTLDEIPADERFDLLCAFEVLEHIEDDAAALDEWVRRIVPGGNVVVSVPAWPERFSITDDEVGHLRRYTPGQLVALAESAGLTDIEARLYGYPLGYGLEPARDLLTRRARRRSGRVDASTSERTQRSGAWHQPPRWANAVIQAGTWPFRSVQRRVPGRGTGLVLYGRVPSESAVGSPRGR